MNLVKLFLLFKNANLTKDAKLTFSFKVFIQLHASTQQQHNDDYSYIVLVDGMTKYKVDSMSACFEWTHSIVKKVMRVVVRLDEKP